MIRQAVRDLLDLGPLPSEDTEDERVFDLYYEHLSRISEPVSNEEAEALATLFGPDDCFGVAWTLLHLIETAPEWVPSETPQPGENEWLEGLRRRARNAGAYDHLE
jgi:hypothetical protein